MADVVDVNVDPGEDFEIDEEGAKNVQRLKERAKHRKGRGFGGTGDSEIKSNEMEWEGIDDPDENQGPGACRSVEGWILFVTGIHEEATEEDVQDKFSEYGKIANLHLNLDRRTGYLKGYAYVEFKDYKEARAAIDATNGVDYLGQPLRTSWAFVKGPQDTRTGSKGGGRQRGRRSGDGDDYRRRRR